MEQTSWIDAGGANRELLEEQYAAFSQNPLSVSSSWRQFFENLEKAPDSQLPLQEHPIVSRPKIESEDRDLRVLQLIDAYRRDGHLIAQVNPIAVADSQEPEQLKLETYGFTRQDLSHLYPTYGFLPEDQAPLLSILQALKTTYCGKIGIEYMGCDKEIVAWLQREMEPSHNQPALSIAQKQMILQQLNKSELLEAFLQTKYVGQKRFSLEGAETLIPMLSALIEGGAAEGVDDFVLGMAHRGRLNVLSNIFNKSYAEVFAEFDEGYMPEKGAGSGDVKYHKGYSADLQPEGGKKVHLELSPNPSHLEAVDPVVEGLARATQDYRGDKRRAQVLPALIHGDAALAGQGVLYETLQFSKLQGYSTGGTLHFVINNQIGFTTVPSDARSTRYCTDLAHAFNMPVFHVNCEDPEECVYATLLALKLRQKFHCDLFIDLNCYRKYGHNEADEPSFTQPIIYQIIRKKKSVRELYRDTLIQQGVVEKYMAESLEAEFKKSLQQALKEIKLREPAKQADQQSDTEKHEIPRETKALATGVDKTLLQDLAKRFSAIPKGFNLHPKIAQLTKERLEMVKDSNEGKQLDWGMAETLAYASLLWEGKSVRISGQDSCRGTFSHRHALWVDQVNEQSYIPLQHIQEKGTFEIYNSPLSENAALGFEFGYSVAAPNSLVVWEAQFGDFCNGGQVVIDQFIVPSEQKWGQISSVVLYLPHGYEGQGPEHSSARMERFLTLAGDDDMRIVNPTTPAQLFHLLRRQTLDPIRKPLVVFTPKGLLRHPACVSRLEELAQGAFQEVLDDPMRPKKVKRLIFCSGRLYYDLSAERGKRQAEKMALLRIEQLYPLDVAKIKELLERYEGFQECIWAQEEPANMGAWEFMRPRLQALLPKEMSLQYIGRERSAATAVGSHALHKQQQNAIIDAVFKPYALRLSHESGIKS